MYYAWDLKETIAKTLAIVWGTVWAQMTKTHQKLDCKKIVKHTWQFNMKRMPWPETCLVKLVKLIGKTYRLISLTSCNVKDMQWPETEIRYVNLLKCTLKKSWNYFRQTYFGRILAIWNHSVRLRRLLWSVGCRLGCRAHFVLYVNTGHTYL